MILVRIALTVLMAASITQLALAGPELADRPKTASSSVGSVPVDEEICELQRYIAFRYSRASAWFDSAPRVLEPLPCRDR